jgi:hypothetical protein
MKYKMTLKHHYNPDIAGYWEYPTDNKPIIESGNTLADMRDKFINWRDRNGLGGGNVPHIKVTDNNNNVIGYFSYNGRLWNNTDFDSQELKI